MSKASPHFDNMVGISPPMQQVYELIEQVAPHSVSVLITGESGTGKELVAQSIHRRSPRSGAPFVAVNTGAIDRGLIGSELFGHEKGAFTGASTPRKGKFELAEGGTLFLDEISTMDERTQVNLLRVLETRRFQRVGGERYHTADVRVVSASNGDMELLVENGDFREDLYHRLNVFRIEVPPLRARGEDILVLADYFLDRYGTEFRGASMDLSESARALLVRYGWPGNIRELEHAIMRSVITAESNTISDTDLPREIGGNGTSGRPHIVLELGTSLAVVEQAFVRRTIDMVGGDRRKAATMLGMSREELNEIVGEEEPQQS